MGKAKIRAKTKRSRARTHSLDFLKTSLQLTIMDALIERKKLISLLRKHYIQALRIIDKALRCIDEALKQKSVT